MSQDQKPSTEGGWCLKAVIILLIWVALAGAGYFLVRAMWSGDDSADDPVDTPVAQPQDGPVPPDVEPAEDVPEIGIGIAYGTEKKHWLIAAADSFAQTPQGKRIKVKLLPRGSIEGADEIVDGNTEIHVWSPASSMYLDVFKQKWALRNAKDPIAKSEILALTPMVFVMWKQRHEAYVGKYSELNFQTIGEALQLPGGWLGIAEKPEWGVFKFGHTYPNKSNSGLMTLVLMAYHFHDKTNGLAVADVVDPEFQSWMGELERGVSGMSHSTGTMMTNMVRLGPSTHDVIFVYESVAIEQLKWAEGRWGEIQVIYPKSNLWNDNPYYILNTEWTTADHQRAAEVFLDHLMSEKIQTQALDHGFRPGDQRIPTTGDSSPFKKYAKYGLKNELNVVCDPPTPEVIHNLQIMWQRAAGSP
jgi:hypothetical protein